MIKILLCSPYKGAVGGIQRWTNNIMKYYSQNVNHNEFCIDFYCLSRKASIVSDINLFKRITYGILEYLILINNFRKEFGKKKYDLVHIASSGSFSLLKDIAMLIIIQRKSVKSVIHFRFGRIPDLYISKNWEYKLLMKVVRLADQVIVLDQTSYNVMINARCTNVHLLPNPLSPEVNQIIKLNSTIKRDFRKILFAGHHIESKGIFELLDACRTLNDVKVKLIGQVSDEMRLKIEKFLGNNTQWIEIAGEQNFENTIIEMLSAGIFVLPTYTEGFPNVILESMACACPIIASNVGAIPEMLNDTSLKKCGICIEPKNVKQLTTEINRMLNDTRFAEDCGVNARIRVNAVYSMPAVWNQMSHLWKTLVNEKIL